MHTPLEHTSVAVQKIPSLHAAPLLLVKIQVWKVGLPEARSQTSFVQGFWSLHCALLVHFTVMVEDGVSDFSTSAEVNGGVGVTLLTTDVLLLSPAQGRNPIVL